MKKLFLLLLLPLLAMAGPNDVSFQQRLASDLGYITRLPAIPAAGANGIAYFNGSTVLPGWLLIGDGLSITSGVLSSTALTQVRADWLATTGQAVIENKPPISTAGMTGQYADLLGIPSTFTPAVHTQPYSTITGAPVINRLRATTAADGTYAWTLPTACATGVLPVVSLTPENSTTNEVINHKLTAVTNTSVSVALSRAVLTLNGLLGVTIPIIQTSPGAQVVHLIAVCP